MDIERPGFWHQLSTGDQNRLIAAGRIGKYAPGATICRQGEPATFLFVLIGGWVKVVTVSRDGDEAVLALRGNGDVVGEFAEEMGGYRTATMYALDDVEAVLIPHKRFSAYLDGCPPAAAAYRRVLIRRNRETADTLAAQPITTGAQRLARLLLELAARHGRPLDPAAAGPEVVITLPLTQEELADLAHVSRATATRALALWRRRNIVQTGHRRVVIAHPDALRRLAALDS
ncbi:MAG TPA: Crp/Fnr family transcriptional regulator [Streptosporangiaceae bacterium]|jgi:CRP-like cAMP-binding protein|nr:Crp/Fnr family transcriptional regulator [Streptosporangiaceae bacterium]